MQRKFSIIRHLFLPALIVIAVAVSRTSQPDAQVHVTIVAMQPTITPSPTPTATPALTRSPTPTDVPPTPASTFSIPIAFDVFVPMADPALHIVQSGDTLMRIAQRYNLTVDELITANQPIEPNRLLIGQALIVPGRENPTAVGLESTRVAQMLMAEIALHKPFAGKGTINGMDAADFVLISPEAETHMIEIYLKGQQLGRNPRAFSKLGDSTIENPHFLARFDDGVYHLGAYLYLQPVIDYYAGSFGRSSAAVRRGLHTWSVLDPMWAVNPACLGGEHMLACEFRVHNPSLLFIRLGSNDAGIPESVDRNLRQIVEYCIENGVIPIIGTKADRFEGASNINNEIIRRIAVEYALPLWDFDVIAGTIPGRGLSDDGVHMTSYYAHDWRNSAAFRTGHGVHSLTALMILEKITMTLNSVPVSATLTPTSTAYDD